MIAGKKLVLFIFICMFAATKVFAANSCTLKEISLVTEEPPFQTEVTKRDYYEDNIEEEEAIKEEGIGKNTSISDKAKDIFHLQVTDNDHIAYLFDDLLKIKPQRGIFDEIGIHGLWRGALIESFQNHDNDTKMNYNILETRMYATLKNKKTSFVATTRFLPQHEFTFMQYFFSDLFIRHRFNKQAVLTIGNTRTHTGEEGSWSELLIPFYYRSQISRQYGNIRKLGIRLSGETSLMDYDIAMNSSGTYFTSFFPGAEFCGWVNFKPFGKTNGKYGDLKIGGGLTAGRRHFDYNQLGAYVSYRYKKFKADFECASGNGSNGRVGVSKAHSRGYYTTLYYDITKKLQLVARFDDFIPNSHDSSHHIREYTAGINYFIKGQALKFILNYVFCEDSKIGNSHRIIIGTQVVI